VKEKKLVKYNETYSTVNVTNVLLLFLFILEVKEGLKDFL
jgi:hypothetical protein